MFVCCCLLFGICFCLVFVCTIYLFVICLFIYDRFVQKPCAHCEICSQPELEIGLCDHAPVSASRHCRGVVTNERLSLELQWAELSRAATQARGIQMRQALLENHAAMIGRYLTAIRAAFRADGVSELQHPQSF